MSHEGLKISRRSVINASATVFSAVIVGAAANKAIEIAGRTPEEEVILSRYELYGMCMSELTWLKGKLTLVNSYAPVTGAHHMIDSMRDLVKMLIGHSTAAVRSLEKLEVLLHSSNNERTPKVLFAAEVARKLVDKSSMLIKEYKAELIRPGSPIRRFDRIARGIDVET